MDFECSRGALARAVGLASYGLGSRMVMPILGGMRLSTIGNRLTLETTDLDRSAQCSVEVFSSTGDATTVLDGGVLRQITEHLPSDERVRISSSESGTDVRLLCGATSFDLPVLDANDFPDLPSLPEEVVANLDVASFHRGFELTGFAAFKASETTRLSLTGIDLVFAQGTLRMMGCNGHRLASHATGLTDLQVELEALVEAKNLAELDRVLGHAGAQRVEVRHGDGQLFFHTDEATFAVRLVADEFPDFERVIPQETREALTFDRLALLDVLQRAAITASEDSGAVRFRGQAGDRAITATSSSRERGETEDRILVIESPKQDFDIAFRASYLIDVVRRLDSPNVAFRFQGDDKACLIEPGNEGIRSSDAGFLYVCMPVHMV